VAQLQEREEGGIMTVATREQLLSTKEAADYCKLSPRTMEGYRVKGKGPVYYKLGNRVRYSVSDLDDWLARCRRTSTSDRGDSPRTWH
jgi:predicted DNA-binding transcriptional regulator AlpA